MINFPTTGWFGDRTVALVNQILEHGIGRLMVTISIDGPKAVHEELRGLPGSWERGIETFRRLRGIRRPNFQVVVGMTLLAEERRTWWTRRLPPSARSSPISAGRNCTSTSATNRRTTSTTPATRAAARAPRRWAN